ncbi:aspartate aminotransferase family protein [Luteibaculum oceani]|uniref:Aspartate aminotransferase family protein n=1 Tax=Luteibaculum oceani TaxID=1294296 RepID=A0A5C6UV69_9FLAO|nr:aspartate aminotransferase family protein [Luteibaculum oceani]TXC76046.1 aspartate aminotransferase family protein [Luteibaculum oceani]
MEKLSQHLAPTSPTPLNLSISRAEGSYLYSAFDRPYLDFISGIGVSNMGHKHPAVVKAIKDQADKHLHVMVYGEMEQTVQTEFAKLLTQQTPKHLNAVYFVNSGTEANEAAIKLARRVTGKSEIIACRKSYHGCTTGSLAISGNEMKKYAFRPLMSGVNFISFNKLEDLNRITKETAAVFIETIQGDAGIRIPDKEWMKALRKRCDETCTLLVMDEIQCGMGRTGSLFAFEQFGISPDLLTLGKALGGGLPIGALLASEKMLNQFASNPVLGHISTFAGHPLACAAGLANLEAMLEENVIAEVENKGKLLHQLLQHPKIVEVRWKGLFFGVELGNAEEVKQVVEACLQQGVLVYWFLSSPNSFRIAPPLNISIEDLKFGANAIVNALNQL